MRRAQILTFALAALAGAVAVFGLTMLIYATFFQSFLEQFQELTPAQVEMISRENISFPAIVLANLAHGALLATVIWWRKAFTWRTGAIAAAIIAFLTEIYFLFTQYALFKTMNLESAIWDTVVWTLVNAVVGALVAWIFARRSPGAVTTSP